jgi:hypothetical protein
MFLQDTAIHFHLLVRVNIFKASGEGDLIKAYYRGYLCGDQGGKGSERIKTY